MPAPAESEVESHWLLCWTSCSLCSEWQCPRSGLADLGQQARSAQKDMRELKREMMSLVWNETSLLFCLVFRDLVV